MLSGDAQSTFEALDAVEAQYGKSLWVVKNRLAAEQRLRGFEAQKRFLREVFQSSERGGIIPFIAHYTSLRNEAAISPGPFRALYNRHLEAQPNLPSGMRIYAAFHILGIQPATPELCSVFLSIEAEGALIDYYQAFKWLISHYYFRSSGMTLPESVQDGLLRSAESTEDGQLSALAYACTGSISFLQHCRPVDLQAFDAFLSGDYDTAVSIGSTALQQQPDAIELLELVARACSAMELVRSPTHDGSLLDDLANAMQSVISKDTESKQNLIQLEKLSLNFQSLPWATALAGFCANELRATPDFEALHFKARGEIPSPYLHPFHAVTLPTRVQTSYLGHCDDRYNETLTTAVVRAFLSRQPSLAVQFSPAQRVLLRAEWALLRADYADALEAARQLSREPAKYFYHKSVRLFAYCLLRLGQLKECIEYVSKVYVGEPTLYLILPIRTLPTLINDQHRLDLRADPSVAIFYDIYSRYIDDKYDYLRQYAFEDLMAAWNVNRPHELRPFIEQFDLAKLIYFLRFVCVSQVMDVSTAFSSSRELEEERLSVCQLLAEIDPVHLDEYQTEIKDITRRRVVQSGIRHIEQTKIYVDIPSIRQFAVQNMKESFNRYQMFASADIDRRALVLDLLSAVQKAQAGGVVAFRLPTDERFDIFRTLVLDVRDEFVSSSEHGLDGYLSVRIRHGTLSGQLRTALEAARLLTQRDRRLGEYRPNEYWASRVFAPEEGLRGLVAIRLAKFSADFDALVEELLSNWLQVRKRDSSIGLFNFELTDHSIRALSAGVTSDTSFEDFLDMVLRALWERLALNLEHIRTRLSAEAKPRFDGLLQNVQADVESLEGKADVSDLVNAIANARTEMQRTINRVIEWFRLPAETEGSPFPLSLPVQIAVESLRRFYKLVAVDPEIQAPEQVEFEANMLAPLVDIFFILFENIMKHSGRLTAPKVKVSMEDSTTTVHIVVRNEIDPDVKTAAALLRVATIRDAIEKGTYRAAVRSEGGTGLFKIRKLLTHDFGDGASMWFGFSENDRFSVEFNISKEKFDERLDR